jgi:FKBP-type peptidyl-prolyl cis-trans isomerase
MPLAFGSPNKLKAVEKWGDAENQSYSAGYAQGGQLHKMDTELGVKFDMPYFQQGFDDAIKDTKSAVTQENMEKSLIALQKSIMEKQRTYMEKQFAENKKKSEDFLKTKESATGVSKLDNGVLYEVVKASDNKTKNHPKVTDKVKVSYKGSTIDGKEFDSNNDVELNLSNVIKGWQVAVQKMVPGDTWRLYIPAAAAYGENGAPGIMPNSALVFDIELKDIVQGSGKASNNKNKNADNTKDKKKS